MNRVKNKWRLVIAVCAFLPYLAGAQDASVVTPPAYSTTTNNFIRSWMAVKPDTATANFTTSSPLQQARMTTQYFDGLGRPVQTVIRQGAYPTGGPLADLVSSTIYDDYGRVQRQYLPFAANSTGGNTSISDGGFKLNPFAQQSYFYSDANMASPIYDQGETYYYGKTEFEASPLNRPERSYAPGNSWVHDGKGIGYRYWVNTATDSVRIWTVTNSGSAGVFGSYSCDSLYKPGALNKKVTIDENNKQVMEFIDKEGKVVLKKVQFSSASDTGSGKGHYGWLCTYYIYDVYGLLRCVVQPKGVELLQVNSWNITWNSNVILNEQCFRYEYDGRRRMVTKKVLGAGEIRLVYDQWDRLVLTQDSNMRAGNQWIFTKYDELNRPIMTGVYTNGSYTTQSSMQEYLYTQNLQRYENTDLTKAHGYTTTYCFPSISTPEVLTASYYDNHDWGSIYGTGYSSRSSDEDNQFAAPDNNNYPYPQPVTATGDIKGMLSGTWTKLLGVSQGITKSFFYDAKSRIVQTISNNITSNDNRDVLTTQYDFSGKVLRTVYRQTKGGAFQHTLLTKTIYEYDDLGRLQRIKNNVQAWTNDGHFNTQEKNIAKFEYNALGQLKKKVLAPTGGPGGGPLDSLEYDYNIRGWSLGVNRSYLYAPWMDNHWFGFELVYDKPGNCHGYYLSFLNAQYNGNITGAMWRSKGDGQPRKYDFTYDAVNRLTGAEYNQQNGLGWDRSAGLDFSISGLSYDANGNIITQKQKGWKLSGSATIDSLTYNYIANSNRLLNVIDGVNDVQTKLGDFRTSSLHPYAGSKSSSTEDYTYDGNGNMVKDLNKDMVTYSGGNGVEYNYLNLPSKVIVKKDGSSNKGHIEYVYDATGNKLKKTVYEPGVDTMVSLYLGGAVYQNDTLQFIAHEEGRIRFAQPDSATCTPKPHRFLYDYFLKDHLGNVRMVLTEQQDTICYPAASVEDSRYQAEDDFYNIDNGRRVSKATTGATQPGFEDKLYRVHGGLTNEKTGLGIVLKVMAGDKVSILAESFYTMPGGGAGSPLTLALTELLAAMTGSSALIANKGPLSTGDVSGIGNNNVDLGQFISNNNPPANTPKAFLTYIVFDEQLKFVSGGADPVQSGGGYKLHNHYINNPITISKTGYLYIYVSNESNLPVYFDNLTVSHSPGPILEETHYYPFGLTMAGISSRAAGKLQNRNKYNGKEEQSKEFSDGSGLDWTDYGARMYDQQIGRWHVADPHSNRYPWATPYNYAFNNPALVIDPDGKDGIVTGSGTQEDPYVIKAKYYYYGLNESQKKGFKKTISHYNNKGKTTEVVKGVFVKYDLESFEVADKKEANDKAGNDNVKIGDTEYRFGNVVSLGNVTEDDELGKANNRSIIFDQSKVEAFTKPGTTEEDVYTAVGFHEIGHNLGGVHGDPGTIMTQQSANEQKRPDCYSGNCGSGIFNYKLSSVDKSGTRAIIGRMNKNYGSVNSQYLSDKETKKVDEKGTNGRIVHVSNSN